MNWYKGIKTSSVMGQTIAKWLQQAQKGYFDPGNFIDDLHQSASDDSLSHIDPISLNNAINEAQSILASSGDTNPFNDYQNAVIETARGLVMSNQQENNNEQAQ